MKRISLISGGVLLAVLMAVPALYASGLLENDQRRLDAAKARHAEQLAAAAQNFRATVERANLTLESYYQRTIDAYERRGDTETAQALEAELAELLASAESLPEAPAAAEPGHVELINAIGPALVGGGKGRASTDILADKDYVLLYFSASWCGPCRAFTPDLVQFHRQYAQRGNFEVVLVGSDRSASDMANYMRQYRMPFPAVPFDRINPSGLQNRYGGRGIPNLVIVDRNGDVVSGSYVNGRYVGPRKVLQDMQALLN